MIVILKDIHSSKVKLSWKHEMQISSVLWELRLYQAFHLWPDK